jgi:hypothetical protein
MSKIEVGQKVLVECQVVKVDQSIGRVELDPGNGFTFDTTLGECRIVESEPIEPKANARPSILDRPYAFARQWYDAEGIHRSFTRPEVYRQLGDGNPVPTDVYSREFAVWMAEEYALAMTKGVQIAKQEMEGLQATDQARIKAIAKEIVAEIMKTEVQSLSSVAL